MCDVVSMLVAGTVASTAGNVIQGQERAAESRYMAQIDDMNAARAERQRIDAIERGRRAEDRVALDGAQVVGGVRAAFAANNTDTGFGSPLDAIINAAVQVEMDRDAAKRNTEREAHDFAIERTNYQNSARQRRADARTQSRAGFIAGIGTALSGGSEVYRYRASIS